MVCAGAGFPDTGVCPVALKEFHACYDAQCLQMSTGELTDRFFEKVDDCPGFCRDHVRAFQLRTFTTPPPPPLPRIILQVYLMTAQARFCLALLTRPWHLRYVPLSRSPFHHHHH
jgi:hypothetical protein